MVTIESLEDRDVRVLSLLVGLHVAAGREPTGLDVFADVERTYFDLAGDVTDWIRYRPLLFGPYDPVRLADLLVERARPLDVVLADPRRSPREAAGALVAASRSGLSPSAPEVGELASRLTPAWLVPLLRCDGEDSRWFTSAYHAARRAALPRTRRTAPGGAVQ